MSLSIALPYSDVVITEKMWHSIILQDKLDGLRPTQVLKSVQETFQHDLDCIFGVVGVVTAFYLTDYTANIVNG